MLNKFVEKLRVLVLWASLSKKCRRSGEPSWEKVYIIAKIQVYIRVLTC